VVQITRQQLCAELGISESTVRRLEQAGLPFTPIGKRTKRYDLEECKTWLRDVYRPGEQVQGRREAEIRKLGTQFMETARKMKRRVEPS
jgi:phage terminase Nu1 subunit (DNA packaging protein)